MLNKIIASLDNALKALKNTYFKYGIDVDKKQIAFEIKEVFEEYDKSTTQKKTKYDELWRKDVARIEVLIEREGMYNALGAILEALQNIEKERANDGGEEFHESQECKNLEHCQEVVSCAMTACDLDITYGHAEARKVAMERFKIETDADLPQILKEQA